MQVVHEDDERVRLVREHLDEAHEDELEAILRLGRRELGNGRLRADDDLELRDEIDDQARARRERRAQGAAPPREALLRLAEELLEQAAEGQGERPVRGALLELIELALDQIAVLTDDRFAELVDERRLADASVAGHEAHARYAVRNVVEHRAKLFELPLAAVEVLRDLELARDVDLAELERSRRGAAALEIGDETERALVAVLDALAHQLGEDPGQELGDLGPERASKRRGLADVLVHPFERGLSP